MASSFKALQCKEGLLNADLGFWSLEILADGVKVASNLIVRSHPETLRAVPAVPSPAPLQAGAAASPQP